MLFEKVTLDKLCSFKNGKSLDYEKSDKNKELNYNPVFGGNGIIGYTEKYNDENCNIVGRVGSNCGNVFYSPNKCWISDNAISVKSKNDINPLFIYYLFNSLDLNNFHIGSGQPLLTQKILKKINVKIPSAKEDQEKIVSLLRSLDEKIELNNQINKNLFDSLYLIFIEKFLKYKENSFANSDQNIKDSWKIGHFEDMLNELISGDWGKKEKEGNYIKKVRCIRGADIPDIQNGLQSKAPIRYILKKNYDKKHLTTNDLIIEISGGSPTQSTGRTLFITKLLLHKHENNLICTNFCKVIRPKDDYQYYMYFYLQYLYNKDVMYSYENGTTGIKNFDIKSFFKNFEVIIPLKNDLNEFNKIAENILETITFNSLMNEKLIKIREALLPKLMSGEIDVSKIEI